MKLSWTESSATKGGERGQPRAGLDAEPRERGIQGNDIMRNRFFAYYPLTADELNELWSNCIFVADTNVLLNLYRYPTSTRQQLLDLLRNIADRIWLPNRVAQEFHENRLKVISQELTQYKQVLTDYAEVLKIIDRSRGHPHVSPGLREELGNIQKRLEQEFTEPKDQLDKLFRNDTILEEITLLYDGRVGSPFSANELERLLTEGEERFQRRIPPGFADRKKPDERSFGDLILWKQMLIHLEEIKQPLVFISDDAKDDWWWRHDGRKIGPQPALKEEMGAKSGKPFHMYSTERFLEEAGLRLGLNVAPSVIEDVRAMTRSQDIMQHRSGPAFTGAGYRDPDIFIALEEGLDPRKPILSERLDPPFDNFSRCIETPTRPVRTSFDLRFAKDLDERWETLKRNVELLRERGERVYVHFWAEYGPPGSPTPLDLLRKRIKDLGRYAKVSLTEHRGPGVWVTRVGDEL